MISEQLLARRLAREVLEWYKTNHNKIIYDGFEWSPEPEFVQTARYIIESANTDKKSAN